MPPVRWEGSNATAASGTPLRAVQGQPAWANMRNSRGTLLARCAGKAMNVFPGRKPRKALFCAEGCNERFPRKKAAKSALPQGETLPAKGAFLRRRLHRTFPRRKAAKSALPREQSALVKGAFLRGALRRTFSPEESREKRLAAGRNLARERRFSARSAAPNIFPGGKLRKALRCKTAPRERMGDGYASAPSSSSRPPRMTISSGAGSPLRS